ncbi:MAC/Perforin domain-containing protein [Tenacibaculum gallaicum]|uniref:MAC/Perforin domain-containing protein n=1 Tax=Tenacibaculum gallaicum TaxID=561505 RepID=A0A3E0I9Y1_9FLAO|nr:MAC/perforin domain-containing protein [Tenacibaculum gallaicum]REH54955.1 MAC/Perforin domain-containing protein [Tenacibaculum gallaicum]
MTTKTLTKKNETKLIVFQKSGATSISYPFDVNDTLAQVRKTLESPKADSFMDKDDYFLNHGSKVLVSSEKTITLSILLDGSNTVNIGSPEHSDPLDPKDGVQHYMNLSNVEKESLFNNIQIFNGLTFNPTYGFQKSFKKIYSWKDNQFPDSVIPRVLTEVVYTDSYSKVTHSLQETSTDSSSVSLNTPYGGGEAEFKYEKSKETSSSKVTEYITGKFLVRKVALQIDLSKFQSSDEFNQAINQALHDNMDNDFQACKAVLEVLNEYGYYVPKQFNLGGALFSSDTTTITEYSESETNKQEFGGSFKAAFDGIGGGASYNHAQGSTEKTTKSDKFQITSFSQVGGRAGTSNDFNEWAKSLDKAMYWGVATFDEMLPSVALISNVPNMNKIIQLFDKYSSYPGVLEVQPYVNLLDYATSVQDLFNPWG